MRTLATILVVISLTGCSTGPGPVAEKNASPSKRSHATSANGIPSGYYAAKVSYFSTQTGGFAKQVKQNFGQGTPFGAKSGPSYIALVTRGWVERDRRSAMEQNARIIAWTQRDNMTLGEPFEMIMPPFVKVVDEEVIDKLLDSLASQHFFDMPCAKEVAMREDGRGGYTLPPGRAWLLVQLDDWRRTVALDDLRNEQVADYTDATNAVAGAFSAAMAPRTSVVVDPIDARTFARQPSVLEGGQTGGQPTPDAEMVDPATGRARYSGAAPAAAQRWWEKEPDKRTQADKLFGDHK